MYVRFFVCRGRTATESRNVVAQRESGYPVSGVRPRRAATAGRYRSAAARRAREALGPGKPEQTAKARNALEGKKMRVKINIVNLCV